MKYNKLDEHYRGQIGSFLIHILGHALDLRYGNAKPAAEVKR